MRLLMELADGLFQQLGALDGLADGLSAAAPQHVVVRLQLGPHVPDHVGHAAGGLDLHPDEVVRQRAERQLRQVQRLLHHFSATVVLHSREALTVASRNSLGRSGNTVSCEQA